jgi:hypothetical protein
VANYESSRKSTKSEWDSLVGAENFKEFDESFKSWLYGHLSELVDRAAQRAKDANENHTKTNMGTYTRAILYHIIEDSMFTGVQQDYVIKVGGNFSVNAQGDATIKSDGDSKIVTKGDSNTHVTGDTDIRIEGNRTVNIRGNVTNTLDGMASTTVRGGRSTVIGGLNSNVVAGITFNNHFGPVNEFNFMGKQTLSYGNLLKVVIGADEKIILGVANSYNMVVENKIAVGELSSKSFQFENNLVSFGKSITRNAQTVANNFNTLIGNKAEGLRIENGGLKFDLYKLKLFG